MQEHSGGLQGNGGGDQQGNNQPPGRPYDLRQMNLVNQLQPQPRQTLLTTPIQVREGDFFGQARYTNVDSDGSESLAHQVNDINNDGAHSRPPPVAASASPPNTYSPVVPSTGILSQTPAPRNGSGQEAALQGMMYQQVAREFGIDVRSGNFTSINSMNRNDSRRVLDFHGQSSPGFSGLGMNEATGGQLRPHSNQDRLQPRQDNTPAAVFEGACVTADEHVPSVFPDLKEILQNLLGREKYKKLWDRCYRSFLDGGKTHEVAVAYADNLLSFQNVADQVKCQQCQRSYDIHSVFTHSQGCPVRQAYLQQQTRSEGAHGSQPSGSTGIQSPAVTERHENQSVQQVQGGRASGGRRSENLPERRMENVSFPPSAALLPSTPASCRTTFQTAEQGATGGYDTTQQTRVKGTGNHHPPDPLATDAAAVAIVMGYTLELAREAILAVRRQTGLSQVTPEQVVNWILERDEQRTGRPNLSCPRHSYSGIPDVTNTSRSLHHSHGYHTADMNTNQRRSQPGTPGRQRLEPAYMQPSATPATSMQSNQANRDPSICQVCKIRKVKVAQYICGHVVCLDCYPNFQRGESRCKICDEEVSDCGAVDPKMFRKS